MSVAKPLFPHTLKTPRSSTKVVYLDMKDWIALAQAHTGHQKGERFKKVLTACLQAVENQTAVFPLSLYTYVEMLKIQKSAPAKAGMMGEVMELVSRYVVVLPRHVIAIHEIEALLDERVGANPIPVATLDYLQLGVMRAFGTKRNNQDY